MMRANKMPMNMAINCVPTARPLCAGGAISTTGIGGLTLGEIRMTLGARVRDSGVRGDATELLNIFVQEQEQLFDVASAERGDAVVLVCTAAATIVFDLVTAVIVGLLVAGVWALREMARSCGNVLFSGGVGNGSDSAWADRSAQFLVDTNAEYGRITMAMQASRRGELDSCIHQMPAKVVPTAPMPVHTA